LAQMGHDALPGTVASWPRRKRGWRGHYEPAFGMPR
jgi:hypothetical protein